MLRTYIHVFQEAVQKVCDTLPWINAIGPIKDYDDVQLGFTLCNINCHIRIDSNKDQTYLTAPATFVTNNKCIPFCSGAELTCLMSTIIVFHMACVPFIRKGFSCEQKFKNGKSSHNWSIYHDPLPSSMSVHSSTIFPKDHSLRFVCI